MVTDRGLGVYGIGCGVNDTYEDLWYDGRSVI